jgi:hypothetical protein
MRIPRLLILAGVVTAFVTAMTLPALAQERVKMPASPEPFDCGGGLILDVAAEGWYQLNTNGERSGVSITTWHQTHTYTNPNTSESLVIQNTGRAKITADGATGAGNTHFGTGVNYGLQDYRAGTIKGHFVDICEVLG